MALQIAQLNLKARDSAALGRFWAAALGWEIFVDRAGATALGPAGFVWPDPADLCLDVVAVPWPATARDRVHLDLATTSPDHQAALVDRLRGLGATPADVGQGGDVPWRVLADPEGNVFCVLEPREVYRDTGPIAGIVVDCADPRAMARFWAEATGWTRREVTDRYARLRSPRGTGPFLEFLRNPAGTVRTRMHLDLVPADGDDQAAEVARLRGLGASPADVGQGDDVPWRVLADPEGNAFCVLAPH